MSRGGGVGGSANPTRSVSVNTSFSPAKFAREISGEFAKNGVLIRPIDTKDGVCINQRNGIILIYPIALC